MNYLTKNSIDNKISITGVQKSQAVNTDEARICAKILNRDYSDNTKKAIDRDLYEFSQFYENRNGWEIFTFSRLIEKDVIDFKIELKEKGQKPASINRKLSSVKILCKEAKKQGYLSEDVTAEVKSLKTQRLSPKSLSTQEVNKLLKEVILRKNKRDLLIISLMLNWWLRVGEVVSLEIQDIDISDRKGVINIRHWKGWKSRQVPIAKDLRKVISEYLESSELKDKADKLIKWQRWPMIQSWVDKIIRKYWSKAWFKLSAHSLRHSYATNFLKNHPWEIVALSQMIGHTNINTTAIYTQNSLEDLQEMIEDFNY